MQIYAALSRLFPRSFTAKVFLIAFIGTHVPLIATLYFLLAERGGLIANLGIAIVMLVATLIGTGATLISLNAILTPLFKVRDAMAAFEQRREVRPLPQGFGDEMGAVMAMTTRLIRDVDDDLRRKRAVADTDPLTGLLNRRGFERMVQPGHAGAVIFADLDRFKAINDLHGHDAGDVALCDAARALAGTLRTGDILARFGGEEFVAFLPGTDMDQASEVAERCRAALDQGMRVDGLTVTASFGVASGEEGDAIADLVNQADAAVYAAKSAGRNRVACAQRPRQQGGRAA